jgi:sugar/nucleoside kinase (ribokinase family)
LQAADVPWDDIACADWLYVGALAGDSYQLYPRLGAFSREHGIKLAITLGSSQIDRGLEEYGELLGCTYIILPNNAEMRRLTGIEEARGDTDDRTESGEGEAAKGGRDATDEVRQSASAQRVGEVGPEIREAGERPSGLNAPAGDRLFDTQDIYGGGDWFVAGPEHLWYVQNNGMDGDNWGLNNVRTGGAGAIGYRVPATSPMAAELRRLASELDALPGGL